MNPEQVEDFFFEKKSITFKHSRCARYVFKNNLIIIKINIWSKQSNL